MIRRFVFIADSQKPGWWTLLGCHLLAVAILLLGLFADGPWVIVGPVVVAFAGGGAFLLGRADAMERQQAERPAKTAQIERELDIG
jgi:hypothetical protein